MMAPTCSPRWAANGDETTALPIRDESGVLSRRNNRKPKHLSRWRRNRCGAVANRRPRSIPSLVYWPGCAGGRPHGGDRFSAVSDQLPRFELAQRPFTRGGD